MGDREKGKERERERRREGKKRGRDKFKRGKRKRGEPQIATQYMRPGIWRRPQPRSRQWPRSRIRHWLVCKPHKSGRGPRTRAWASVNAKNKGECKGKGEGKSQKPERERVEGRGKRY